MTRTGLPFAVLVLVASPAFAQVPAGPEFQINTFTTAQQGPYPSIASDAAGNFVVVWMSNNGASTSDIFGQRYDAAGVRRGGEFRINAYTTFRQELPRVAADRNGNFVVVWDGYPTPFDGNSWGVTARRFDASGAPRSGDFLVNTFTTGPQFHSAVSSDLNGNFVVAWDSLGQDGSGYGVFAQRYDASGTRRGGEFRVNSYTTGSQGSPAVAVGASGAFVVVWEDFGQDGSFTGIFGQRFNEAGLPQGPEFRVNTYTTDAQFHPSVAAAAAGSFVVAWSSNNQDGDSVGVFAQRFDAAGAPQGPERRVNAFTTGFQGRASVSSAPNGDFVIAWDGYGPGEIDGVFGQRYDAAGVARGGPIAINTWTTDQQTEPSVAVDAAGNFVIAWDSGYQDGSAGGLFGQRFGAVTPAPTTLDRGGNGIFEPGETIDVTTAWRNVSGTTQSFTGAASLFTGPGAPNDPTYTIVDGTADYGTVPSGAVASCGTTGNCYRFGIGPVTLAPTVRPVLHWDASFREDILPVAHGESLTRALHIGDSFGDVPQSSPYYRFVETILHHDLTGGCGGGNFCPLQSTPREQMAVFVLVAKEGAGYQPPACIPGLELFTDVPASSPFCRWIEELAHRSIAGGCGGGNFCPLGLVSREQMSVFALATKEPAGYSPPACVAGSERFADVPASSPFCKWVEELARRNIAGGCGGGNFCPIAPVSREQNSVFISGTFALTLY